MTDTANFKPCPHRELCGGCKYNGEDYESVIKIKENETLSYLSNKGIDTSNFLGIESSPQEWRFSYRNKMEYTFGDMVKGGELCLGMHKAKHFMSIITVDECQLVTEDFNTILKATLEFARERNYTHYHKKTHEGLLRNLLLRRGVRTNELLINIVTTSEAGFDEDEYVKLISSLELNDTVVGILRTFNDALADAVICDSLKLLKGQDYYTEKISGLTFKVSPFAFFQTNIDAIERLYAEAVSLLENIEGKNVFDLYCGTGTISQIIARKAKSVLGIDIVQESIDSAIQNSKINGLQNCNFISGDVFEVLNSLEDDEMNKPDVIVVDPPRVGMRTNAVNKIASYGVDEILYISCNPKTLAIDLADFKMAGYKVKTIKAYDNFCWTKHVEAVTLLTK